MVFVKEGRGEYIKLSQQPLFGSVVFVRIAESDVRLLLSIPCVLTMAYWKSKPAVISDSEIEIIKKVTATYADIKLEKTAVESGQKALIIDGPDMEFNEKTVSVKYNSVKAKLPSLGFIISGESPRPKAGPLYPPQGLFTSFPKRLNAFFFN